MTKEEYEKLRKKYSLPDYDTMDNEFEVSSIEEKTFLLRAIRRKIVEKTGSLREILETILQPGAESFADLHECRFFGDNDKKKIIEIYKKLMILDRFSSEVDLIADEKKDAEFITEFFREWDKLKKSALPFLEMAKKCWEEDIEIEEKLEYMG